MRAVVVIEKQREHHVTWCGAMAAGLSVHGIQPHIVGTAACAGETRADFAVCWGWRLGAELRQAGLDVLVMERGHLPEREAWAACGWNGLGRRARYSLCRDAGERFEANWGHYLHPWGGGGSRALLLGQCSGDQSLRTMSMPQGEWLHRTAATLKHAGFQVSYRPHPLEPGAFCPEDAVLAEGSLDDALAAADLAVTFNSTAGVEAALAGVSVVALDEGAMVWDVAQHGILEPEFSVYCPDRTVWADRLAWAQYSFDEVRSGFAWECVLDARPQMQETA